MTRRIVWNWLTALLAGDVKKKSDSSKTQAEITDNNIRVPFNFNKSTTKIVRLFIDTNLCEPCAICKSRNQKMIRVLNHLFNNPISITATTYSSGQKIANLKDWLKNKWAGLWRCYILVKRIAAYTKKKNWDLVWRKLIRTFQRILNRGLFSLCDEVDRGMVTLPYSFF